MAIDVDIVNLFGFHYVGANCSSASPPKFTAVTSVTTINASSELFIEGGASVNL